MSVIKENNSNQTFYISQKGKIIEENVEGLSGMLFLYTNPFGKIIRSFFNNKYVANLYSYYKNSFLSKYQIKSFIEKHKINVDELEKNVDEFKSILNNKNFKKYFDGIHGEKLKSAPRGFSKDLPDLDLIKNKHYAVIHKVTDEFWLKENLIENIIKVFEEQKAFNAFLNELVID
jgi:hypothetical protein